YFNLAGKARAAGGWLVWVGRRPGRAGGRSDSRNADAVRARARLSLMRWGGFGPRRGRPSRPAQRRQLVGQPAARLADERPAAAARSDVGVLRRRDQWRRVDRLALRSEPRSPNRAHAPGRAAVPDLRRGDEPRPDCRRCLWLPVLLGTDVAQLLGAGGRTPYRSREPAREPSLPGDGGARHGVAAVRLRWPGRSGGRLFLRGD